MTTCSFPGCEAHQLMRLANTADNRVVLICKAHYAWGMVQVQTLGAVRKILEYGLQSSGVPQEDPEGTTQGTVYALDAVPQYEKAPSTMTIGEAFLRAHRNSLH